MNVAATLLALACLALGETAHGAPARPEPCREVGAGADLQARLDSSADGDALCLAPGEYAGPLRVGRSVTVFGPRAAVIRAGGSGSTVSLEAPGAALLGLTVDGSGGRFDLLDAAVRVTADDVRVEHVQVRGALFGILASRASRVSILDNEILGDARKPFGLRGDSIRLWEVRDSVIERNRASDGRDVVVWYSPRNRIVGNRIERGRYGVHFMYSHDNLVADNRVVGNVVGVFAMYSRHLRIERNLLARSAGAAGMGLGAKEAGDLSVTDNTIAGNTVGIHLDNSPLEPDEWNVFRANRIVGGQVGISFQGVALRNRFADNDLAGNGVQVRIEGGGSARGAEFDGNAWDDYTGYDLDGDGRGDLAYELRTLAGDLTTRNPQLSLFRGSPAMWLVEIVGHVVPLFRPTTILVDPTPRVGGTAAGAPDAS